MKTAVFYIYVKYAKQILNEENYKYQKFKNLLQMWNFSDSVKKLYFSLMYKSITRIKLLWQEKF